MSLSSPAHVWPPLPIAKEWKGDALASLPVSASWKMLLGGDGSPTRLFSVLSGCPTVVSIIDVEEFADESNAGGHGDAVGFLAVADDISKGQQANNGTADSKQTQFLDQAPPEVRTFFLPKPESHGSPASPAAPSPSPSSASSEPTTTIIRRRIWLKNARGDIYGYAVSWWDGEVYKRVMPDPSKPIGGSMASAKLDIYRDIHAVYACSAASADAGIKALDGDGADAIASRRELLKGLGVDVEEKETSSSAEAPSSSPSPSSSPVVWCRYYTMWHRGKPLSLVCEVFSPVGAAKYLGQP